MKYNRSELSKELDAHRTRARRLVSGLTAEQLTWRPDPSKWSIAECIAHLNVTATAVQKFMDRAIERGRQEKKSGSGPFSIGPKGWLMVWVAEPPPKFRLRAPKNVRPPATIADPLQLLPEFLYTQEEWERLMREQEGLDLARIIVGQGPFRMRLAAALPWMMAHQRRHLLQAENVKRQIKPIASSSSMGAS